MERKLGQDAIGQRNYIEQTDKAIELDTGDAGVKPLKGIIV